MILGLKSLTAKSSSTHILVLEVELFVFFDMKMSHQSVAATAALFVVVLVFCSSGATARELREADIFERILGGVTIEPSGTGNLHNIPGDVAKGAGAAAGNLTVLGSPGPSTTVAMPPINIDIIPPTPTALPPCVAVPPVSVGALPPSLRGAVPPVPGCIGVPPVPSVRVPSPSPSKR